MNKTLLILLTIFCASAGLVSAADPGPFAFNQNDRVVFIGDSFFERDLAYNYLETMLSVRFHGKGLTFRNLGWSGDTVWGEARSVFGTQKDGYNALIKAVNEARPNVVFICYGMNESFDGAAGLAHFEEGYNALLDNVLNPAKDGEHVAAPPAQAKDRKDPKDVPVGGTPEARPVPRVVLLTPFGFEDEFMSKVVKKNKNVELYVGAIERIAAKRGATLIHIYAEIKAMYDDPQRFAVPVPPLTSDTMHLTAFGHFLCATIAEKKLGLKEVKWDFARDNFPVDAKFNYDPIGPNMAPTTPIEKLRKLIGEKNQQFFNKWRPQNETYLFLFRKHEQGRNAKEIPEFDPFIAAKEAEISKLADAVAKQMGL